jgi:hypothetical protein
VDSFFANEDIQDLEHKLRSIVASSCKDYVIEFVLKLFEKLHHGSFPSTRFLQNTISTQRANSISPRPWPLEETSSTREPLHVHNSRYKNPRV